MNLSLQLAMSFPKPATQFPLFLPPPPHNHRPATEIRFARWNNANAQKFVRKERTQKELEDQIRFHKRHDSAQSIAQKYNYNPAPPHRTTTGTPSLPSAPSIPGKKSKYSKPDYRNTTSHPAFKPLVRTKQLSPNPKTPNFKVDENGVSFDLPEAPFLYQYSYTETPKVKPVKLREPLVSPFGPETMAKPWMGRKPLPESRKNLPEFDSFNLPPPYKKGVKSVQAPGPYLPGSGPKYVRFREEVLGEPLTKEEIEELVTSCRKSYRQLNMGRDGLTHNMLDNIHDLWKRRRVCKIRCLGVCTVDMDNVRQQLEEKTGGKIIAGKGGIVYLFRGRNYNYKSRPRYPLMLWKPVSPVYPRLIKHAPEGLTLEEATEMRRKGRDLTPICKLAKNGVYCNLVKHVREAFEACELVRINCQGLNPSDYRKIGAKLKDLVPCVLLSFEYEHILIWRGREWKSSLPEVKGGPIQLQEKVGGKELALGLSELPSSAPLSSPSSNSLDVYSDHKHVNGVLMGPTDLTEVGTGNKIMLDGLGQSEMGSEDSNLDEMGSDSESVFNQLDDQLSNTREAGELVESPWSEGVLLLKKQAVENGMAIVLDDDSLDADIILKKALAFSETAPAGPVFRHQCKKVAVENSVEEAESSKLKEQAAAPSDLGTVVSNSVVRGRGRKGPREKKLKDIKVDYFNVVPEGKLRVDELAKLLM